MESDQTAGERRTSALGRAWETMTGQASEQAGGPERVRLWLAGMRGEPTERWLALAREHEDPEDLADRLWLGAAGAEISGLEVSSELRAVELVSTGEEAELEPVSPGLRLDHRTLAALNRLCQLEGDDLD